VSHLHTVWRCRECPEHGEGLHGDADREADRHTKATSHTTQTFTMEQEDE